MRDCIGIEIGGTKLQLVTGEADGKIIERRKFAVDHAKGARGIRTQIEQGLRDLLRTQKPKAVGGGLVVDGWIYHGAMPGEAELGHVRLARSGTTLESRCSGWAVDARIRALKKSDPSSLLARLIGDAGRGEAKHLPAALQQGDT